jgi:hypothetical protein
MHDQDRRELPADRHPAQQHQHQQPHGACRGMLGRRRRQAGRLVGIASM